MIQLTPALQALALLIPATGMWGQSLPDSVTVVIEGVRGEVGRNVRAHLSIARYAGVVQLPDARVQRFHEQADAEIRRALEPFGFYRPSIQSELTRGASGWVARYLIAAGDPVTVASVDIQLSGPGTEDPALRSVMRGLELRSGAPLRHTVYERAKSTLRNTASARGYFDARFLRNRVEVDLDRYEAHIALHMDTGVRYHFGPVSLPTSPLREEVLRRYVSFRTGDPFLLDELLLLQRRMTASDYFAAVSVGPRMDEVDGTMVPIAITARPQNRVGYGLGLGYGTDTGPRATAGGRIRWLNPSGHRLSADIRVSMKRNSASIRYLVPLLEGPEHDFAVTAGFLDQRFEGNESESLRLSGSLTRQRWGWKEAISLDFQREKFESGGDRGQAALLFPTLAWSRIRGDDPIFPARGSRVAIEIRGAAEALASDISFLQASLRTKVIRSPIPGARIIARMDLGSTAVDDLNRLPVSFRFFAGGDHSIRGFAYQSAGPVDEEGNVVGGRHLITAALECEQWFWEKVGFGVFADLGNAFRDLSSPHSLEKGVGFGARWRSPVGPLRLDLAWALTLPGNPLRLHFIVGGEL